jgi:hypothetical protein
MTSLSDRLLVHAQALENQALHAEKDDKPFALRPGLYAESRGATAKLLREAAKELSGGDGR